MSWLGDSLTTWTGQLSNFTKEVLTESREEVEDHPAELAVANQRIKTLEQKISIKTYEVEKLRQTNHELEERLLASDLQSKAVSQDFQLLLQTEKTQIKRMKEQHTELQERYDHLLSRCQQNENLAAQTTAAATFANSGGDADDINDVISCQYEINRLRAELDLLRLGSASQSHGYRNQREASEDENGYHGDGAQNDVISSLHLKIQELEAKLKLEVETHHKELSALEHLQALQVDVYEKQLQKFRTDMKNDESISEDSGEKNDKDAEEEKVEKDKEEPKKGANKNTGVVKSELQSNRTDDFKEVSFFVERMQTLQKQVENVLAEKEQLQGEIKKLDQQHELAIKQVIGARDNALNRCVHLQQEIDDLSKNLRTEKNGHQGLYNELQVRQEESNKKCLGLEREHKIIKTVLNEIGYMDDCNDVISEQVRKFTVFNSKQLEMLQKDAEQLQSSVDKQNGELIENEQYIKQLSAELNENKQKVHDLQLAFNEEFRNKSTSNFEINEISNKDINERIEAAVRASNLEKERLVAILNEKACENSSLRLEVHRLMEAVTSLQRGNSTSHMMQNSPHENGLRSDETTEMTKEALKKMAKLVREKEIEIEALSEKNKSLIEVLQKSSPGELSEIENMMKQSEELAQRLRDAEAENYNLRQTVFQKDDEISKLDSDWKEESQMHNNLKQGHSSLILQFETKQKALIDAQDKIVALKSRISDLEQRLVDLERCSQMLSAMELKQGMRKTVSCQTENLGYSLIRDEELLNLKRYVEECVNSQKELKNLREREQKLMSEVQRLRNHLLEIEESYTEEALQAEEREKTLRLKLLEKEEHMQLTSSSYTSANQQATMQMKILQEQLGVLAKQRDDALSKLSSSEDQAAQLAASLQTLQVVLQQLQKEKERELGTARSVFESDLQKQKVFSMKLQEENKDLEIRLADTMEALDAASRLSEQLDRKEEYLASLQDEVAQRHKALQKAQEEIQLLSSTKEGMVEKVIMKNLFVGFFSAPHGHQKEVLRVIGTVLDFDQDERIKTGLESIGGGWFSGFLKRSPPQTAPVKKSIVKSGNQSLSEAFVRFLETESQPRPQVKMPIDGLRTRHEPAVPSASTPRRINPFLTSNDHNALSPSPIMFTSTPNADSAHLLMKPISASFPTFTPAVIMDQGSSAPSVLQSVLRENS